MSDLSNFETCDFYVRKNPLKGSTDYNVYSVTNNKLMGWMVQIGDEFQLKIMRYAIKYCGKQRSN